MDIATRIQMLGAHPLPFYQHFNSPKYVKPEYLFPLVPEINEIEQIPRTREDIEREEIERRKAILKYLENSSKRSMAIYNIKGEWRIIKSKRKIGSLLDIMV